jgi:hypothetical protein
MVPIDVTIVEEEDVSMMRRPGMETATGLLK